MTATANLFPVEDAATMKIKEDITARAVRLSKVIALVCKSHKIAFFANIALIFVKGTLPLASLYLTKKIIDSIADILNSGTTESMLSTTGLFILLAATVHILLMFTSATSHITGELLSQSVADRVYDTLHEKSVEVDIEYYESPEYYDKLHLAQQEAPFRPVTIVESLTQIGQSLVLLIAISALITSFHWSIGIILIVAAVPALILRIKNSEKNFTWRKNRTSIEREAGYLNWMLTGDSHAKEIRLYGLGELFKGRFSAIRRKLKKERMKLLRKRTMADLTAKLFASASVFACFAFIAFRASRNDATIGDLAMFYQALQKGYSSLSELFTHMGVLYENDLFLRNYFEFLGLKPKIKEIKHPKDFPLPIKDKVSFRNINFRYPSATDTVLSDVSFDISRGEHVALVGENAAGKTTLIKLLARLYDPVSGEILIDGTPLKEMSVNGIRSNTAILFQDYVKYQLSAGENIRLGNTDIPMGSELIRKAAIKAGADKTINTLENSYNSRLGKWFPGGKELSEGQWQRIALARSLIRDAQILVLDEPTASLDIKTEEQIISTFKKIAEGKTAIIISHRMSTVRMADRIIVLHNGCIAEEGSHEELLSADGMYAELFRTQASHYS